MATFIRYSYQDSIGYGRLDNHTVYPLTGSFLDPDNTESGNSIPVDKVCILAPVMPSKAVCVGLNYKAHTQELNMDLPTTPVLFMKPSTAVIAHKDVIVPPAWMSSRTDYEGELVIVIGKTAHRVNEKDASSYIFGYTIGNDVTARDLQNPQGQWTVAKGFDTFLPLGPVVKTGIDVSDISVETRVNGVVKQQSSTSHLIFKPAFLVSYISQVMTLYPGDIIMTGTPAGIGPVSGGDVIEVSIGGIGTLSNTVAR